MKLCDFCEFWIDNKCYRHGVKAYISGMRVKVCSAFRQHHPESCDVLFQSKNCELGFSSVEHLKKTERNKNLKIRNYDEKN